MSDWTIRDDRHVSTPIFASPGIGWTIIGTGDFTGGGVTDVLFKNSATNALVDWQMDNGKLETTRSIGDFYGNGISDVMISNAKTGMLEVGLVDASGHITGWKAVGALSPSAWRFAA